MCDTPPAINFIFAAPQPPTLHRDLNITPEKPEQTSNTGTGLVLEDFERRKIPPPNTFPELLGRGIQFSPDGQYLACLRHVLTPCPMVPSKLTMVRDVQSSLYKTSMPVYDIYGQGKCHEITIFNKPKNVL